MKTYITDHQMAVIFLNEAIQQTIDVRDTPGEAHEQKKVGFPEIETRIERLQHAHDYFYNLLREAEDELIRIIDAEEAARKKAEKKAKKEARDA